jgi:hypothetical protein
MSLHRSRQEWAVKSGRDKPNEFLISLAAQTPHPSLRAANFNGEQLDVDPLLRLHIQSQGGLNHDLASQRIHPPDESAHQSDTLAMAPLPPANPETREDRSKGLHQENLLLSPRKTSLAGSSLQGNYSLVILGYQACSRDSRGKKKAHLGLDRDPLAASCRKDAVGYRNGVLSELWIRNAATSERRRRLTRSV